MQAPFTTTTSFIFTAAGHDGSPSETPNSISVTIAVEGGDGG
jgi:hypothetical protein